MTNISIYSLLMIALSSANSYAQVAANSPEVQHSIGIAKTLFEASLERDHGRSVVIAKDVLQWKLEFHERTQRYFLNGDNHRVRINAYDGSFQSLDFLWYDEDSRHIATDMSKALSQDECWRIAQEYLRTAEFASSYTMWDPQELVSGQNHQFMFEVLPETKPWPLAFQYSAVVAVDRSAGQLCTLTLRRIPELSHANDHVLPDRELDQIAETMYWANKPFNFGNFSRAFTVLDVPAYGEPGAWTSEQTQLVKGYKAIPLRFYEVFDLEILGRDGKPTNFQWVILDARNGRLLKAEVWEMKGSLGSTLNAPAEHQLTGKWILNTSNSKPQTVIFSGVDLVVAPKDGIHVRLSRDGTFLNAYYSSGSNLVYGVYGDARGVPKVIAGRPDEASRRLILKSLASKHN